MNYKNELEKYLNISTITKKTNDKANITTLNKTQPLEESILLPPRYYSKVVEECLNFEEVNSKKVNINKYRIMTSRNFYPTINPTITNTKIQSDQNQHT